MLGRFALVLALLVAGHAAGAAELALKRVMLSTGGVGYLEYEAAVDGDATLSLDVGLDQVDDVLKSLVVYDSAGSVGEITLPGREPLAQSFADLPFDRAALDSAKDLLNALAGAEIRVTGSHQLSGRLIHADDEQIRAADGHVESRLRIAVSTPSGIQQFPLQESDSVAFADAALQSRVDGALARVAAYRAPGRRQLSLTVHGKGRRTIRVGYVVAMPLWKATYRLSLPETAQAATAHLQGWAVLENFSGQAWRDVELTLLSGNPVTFRQALYESYYVPRPVVPVESGSRILPAPDSGAVGTAATAAAAPAPEAPKSRAFALAAPVPAPPPAAIEAARAEEGATQIAFTAPGKISVGIGQSLILPLLDRDLPARQLDFYQPSVEAHHPLAAVELTNAGDTGLPPGVLTLYRQGGHGAEYLGDARLAALPAGDKRLLSFAADAKVTIDRAVAERRDLVKATLAEGVMRLSRTQRQTTTYRIKSTGAPPPLLVEQPRQPGWTLAAPDPHEVEVTASGYRIPVASGTAELAVVEERPLVEVVHLADLHDDALAAYAAATEFDPALRKALGELAARRQAVSRERAELERLKAHRAELVADETRLRDNLTALGHDAALHKRVLDKFAETETAIDAATEAVAKATAATNAAETALAAYVAGLRL
jgi:hypothetical protein